MTRAPSSLFRLAGLSLLSELMSTRKSYICPLSHGFFPPRPQVRATVADGLKKVRISSTITPFLCVLGKPERSIISQE